MLSACAPARRRLAAAFFFCAVLVVGMLATQYGAVRRMLKSYPPEASEWLSRLLFADFPATFETVDFNFRPCATLPPEHMSATVDSGGGGSVGGADDEGGGDRGPRHRVVDSFPSAATPFATVRVGNYGSRTPEIDGEGLHAYNAYLSTADLVVRDERCCDKSQRSKLGCDSSFEYPRVPGCPEAEGTYGARTGGGGGGGRSHRAEEGGPSPTLQGYFLTIQYFCDLESASVSWGVFKSSCTLGDLHATVVTPSPLAGGGSRQRSDGDAGEVPVVEARASRNATVYHLRTIASIGVRTLVLRITPQEARANRLKVEFRGKGHSDIRFDIDFCRVRRASAHTHGISYCGSPLYGRKVNAKVLREFVTWHRRAGISSFHFYDREPNVTGLRAALQTIREAITARSSSSSSSTGSNSGVGGSKGGLELEITYTTAGALHADQQRAIHDIPDGIQSYALNHCVLNARHNSRWIWAADLDEYVFPTGANQESIDTCARPGYFFAALEALRAQNRNFYSAILSGTPYTNDHLEGGPLRSADISSYVTKALFRTAKLEKGESTKSRKSATRSDLAEQLWVHNSYGCSTFQAWQTYLTRRFMFLLPPLKFKTECVNTLPLGFAHFKLNEYMNMYGYHSSESVTRKRIGTYDASLTTLRDRFDSEMEGCGAEGEESPGRRAT